MLSSSGADELVVTNQSRARPSDELKSSTDIRYHCMRRSSPMLDNDTNEYNRALCSMTAPMALACSGSRSLATSIAVS